MNGIQCELCGNFRPEWSGYYTVTDGYNEEVSHYCSRRCLANDNVQLADTERLRELLIEIDGKALAEAMIPK